jgi:hypothetical protein
MAARHGMRKQRRPWPPPNRTGIGLLALLALLAALGACGSDQRDLYRSGNIVVSSRHGIFTLDQESGERCQLARYEPALFPPLITAVPDGVYLLDSYAPRSSESSANAVIDDGTGMLLKVIPGQPLPIVVAPLAPCLFRPSSSMMGSDGRLLVFDPVGNPAGQFLGSGLYQVDPTNGQARTIYYGPELMTVTDGFYDGQDIVFVDKDSDPYNFGMMNGAVLRWRAATKRIETVTSLNDFVGPEAIVAGPNHTAYVSNDMAMGVGPVSGVDFYRVNLDTGKTKKIGSFMDYDLNQASNYAHTAMTLGHDGRLYFVIFGIAEVQNKVYQLDPDGGGIMVFYDGRDQGPTDYLWDIDTIP